MPITFYTNGDNRYVKDDTDKQITVYFDKTKDPVHAAELTDYEAANGPVTEEWVEPPPPPEAHHQMHLDLALLHMAEEKVAEMQWSPDKQYHVGDIVLHNGMKWRATSNNSGNEPDDVPGDWEKVI